ncbi:MAG: RluA family pseudouridine synthase, partial [Methylocystaceae bacterium]
MDNNELVYVVKSDDQYVFLRDVVKKEMHLSRALIINLKQQKKIMVNGAVTLTNYRLKPGDVVSVDLALDEESTVEPENIPLDIVYEDQDFLLINKPPRLAVHPSKGLGSGTLANAVVHYWQAQGRSLRFRPINRLDRDTSGLILIGKSQYAHQAIAYQQKKGIIHREYQAVVEGVMADDQGCIDLPIARKDPELRERM